ncbi:hypothetical protein BCR43DRAFT_497514 [Syncephalastrum racemosum]|uniref:BHLH domain-containing protein n=1 Tax=Syncephalastrum racemosum TaxID=13706 RepID=A0A1X2H2B8_SYNRA|nr:hypothetical protein BCR43DRAFT_497514 [Syncephalastrum racemosum]
MIWIAPPKDNSTAMSVDEPEAPSRHPVRDEEEEVEFEDDSSDTEDDDAVPQVQPKGMSTLSFSSPSSSSSSPTSSSAATPSAAPGPPQALFLNFTSDLLPQNKKKAKPKRKAAYKVNGVNILNRNNLDSKTAIERIQRRRENHNHVERRRRDVINNTILEIAKVVPNAAQPGQKPNKGNVLKLALDYIQALQQENDKLKHLLEESPYHLQHHPQHPHSHPHPHPHAPVSQREHGARNIITPQTNASTVSSGHTPSPSAPTSPAVRLFEHRSASVPSSPKDGLPAPGGIIAPLSLPPASAFQQILPSPHHPHHPHRHPAPSAAAAAPTTAGTTPAAASPQQSTYKPLRPIMPAPQQQPQQPSPPQTQPSPRHFPPLPPHHPYHPPSAATPTLHHPHPHPHSHSSPSLLPSPASTSASPNHPSSHSPWLPPQRMTKYEKVYGNTCRY